MRAILERFHSFTCTPMRLSTNRMNHTCCLWILSRSLSSVTDWSEGRLIGLSTTTVSKQSVQERYVTGITAVSCSNRHASLGNWGAPAISVELTTSRAVSRDANHWATESAKTNYMRVTRLTVWCMNGWVSRGLTSHSTLYRSFRGRFLQARWPNQQRHGVWCMNYRHVVSVRTSL